MKDQKKHNGNIINNGKQLITCGNCWGYQEWNDEIVDEQENISKWINHGFIVNFMRKYLRK